VDVIRHDREGVELEPPLLAISKERCEEASSGGFVLEVAVLKEG